MVSLQAGETLDAPGQAQRRDSSWLLERHSGAGEALIAGQTADAWIPLLLYPNCKIHLAGAIASFHGLMSFVRSAICGAR